MNTEAVKKYIVQWLDSYAEKANVKGFVVGVSGGVDSALTSTLCALTGREVLLLELPIHQAESQVTRAHHHCQKLSMDFENVRTKVVDLTAPFEAFIADLPTIENSDQQQLTLANTRARLRMTTLYHFAGLHGLLVAGTGNKVEDFGVGFYTKYGDGGVDVSPIADLLKTEVFQLAKSVGVSNEILTAPPTDGLFGDDRSDEDQLGASYPELEWAMQYDKTAGKRELTDREQEVLKIYRRLNTANQHKMHPIPVCVLDGIK